MFKDTKRDTSSRQRGFSRNITDKGLYPEYIENSWKSVRNRQATLEKMYKKIQESNSQEDYLSGWIVKLRNISSLTLIIKSANGNNNFAPPMLAELEMLCITLCWRGEGDV